MTLPRSIYTKLRRNGVPRAQAHEILGTGPGNADYSTVRAAIEPLVVGQCALIRPPRSFKHLSSWISTIYPRQFRTLAVNGSAHVVRVRGGGEK